MNTLTYRTLIRNSLPLQRWLTPGSMVGCVLACRLWLFPYIILRNADFWRMLLIL
jgi:hypothetical protein